MFNELPIPKSLVKRLNKSDISPIVNHQLYLSSISGTKDTKTLKKVKITHIVSICLDPPDSDLSKFETLHLSLTDASQTKIQSHFENAHEIIDEAIEQGGACLV